MHVGQPGKGKPLHCERLDSQRRPCSPKTWCHGGIHTESHEDDSASITHKFETYEELCESCGQKWRGFPVLVQGVAKSQQKQS